MGLDMYLYLRKEKYRSNLRKTIEYPDELKAFQYGIERRNFSSIEEKADYQIGYWRKFWPLHDAICNIANRQDENWGDIELSKADVADALEWLEERKEASATKPEAKNEIEECEYSIKLFNDALAFLEAHEWNGLGDDDWSLVYHASW